MRNFSARSLVLLLVLMAIGLAAAECYANNKSKSKALSPTASAKSVKHEEIIKISDQIDSLVLSKLEEEGIK